MPRVMTEQEILNFMMAAPRTGHLATAREDGRPHVSPLWFTVDGGSIVFATASSTVKGRNLRRAKFAALSVDDGAPPFSYVALEGPVELDDDMRQVRRWAEKIAARYIGEAAAAQFVQLESFPDDLICRLTPSHMSGLANMAE